MNLHFIGTPRVFLAYLTACGLAGAGVGSVFSLPLLLNLLPPSLWLALLVLLLSGIPIVTAMLFARIRSEAD